MKHLEFITMWRVTLLVVLTAIGLFHQEQTLALQCKPDQWVYGENQIVDELMTCSLSKSFDIDLTPHGDRIKPTSKTLVEQGLSNKTTIMHAKLSGLWTGKRPQFIETGWKCTEDEIVSTSIVEISSLSLVVIEKLDMQVHRNQHMLAVHRPCKTLDLPVLMCRQSKPIYRTTTTWVNRAYFNLTLSQRSGETRPTLRHLSPMFTCPEAFKQKITHSPSSTYVLARHVQQMASQLHTKPHQQHSSDAANKLKESQPYDSAGKSDSNIKQRETRSVLKNNSLRSKLLDEPPMISHPSSFTTIQSGKMPASPPYHNSVSMIMNQVSEVLLASLNDCIHLIDSDLSLMSDHESFSTVKCPLEDFDDSDGHHDEQQHHRSNNAEEQHKDEISKQSDDLSSSIKNECSNKMWIKSRIELANEMSSLAGSLASSSSPSAAQSRGDGHTKRDQYMTMAYPSDPGQLLDPFGYYHQGMDQGLDEMIDDSN